MPDARRRAAARSAPAPRRRAARSPSATSRCAPTAPPVASEPSLRPNMPRQHARRAIGTPMNRKIARSCSRSRAAARRASRPARRRRRQAPRRRCAPMSWSTAAFRPPAKSPGAKRRRDRVVDDAAGREVGHRAFERLRDLDAHAAVVLRDDDSSAVADVLAADLPGVGDALRVGARCPRAASSAPSARRSACRVVCSKAASLASSAVACVGVSVPVWSMTRAGQRRHRQHVLRDASGSRRTHEREPAASAKHEPRDGASSRRRVGCGTCGGAACRSSTVGGTEICASFCDREVRLDL